MATEGSDHTRLRFLGALARITAGLEAQRQRISDKTARAPRLFEGTSSEITDLRGDAGNHLDYYVFELSRLREVIRIANEKFGRPAVLVDALSEFDTALPQLRSIRDPLTHPSGDGRLDGVMWFDSVVKLGPNGSVEYLIDPRYEHHDAALKAAETLRTYLESGASAC